MQPAVARLTVARMGHKPCSVAYRWLTDPFVLLWPNGLFCLYLPQLSARPCVSVWSMATSEYPVAVQQYMQPSACRSECSRVLT